MANINFFALGGQDETGKNSYVLEVENNAYVIDCGVKHPVRNNLGVDAIIPNFTYLEKNKEKIKGLFITHAHDLNFAALPWLLMNVQGLDIYASKFTVSLIKERIEKYNIGHTNYNFIIFDKPIKLGEALIKPFSLAHSIPGTLGFDFQTPDGSFIFMNHYLVGDLKEFGNTDLNEIKKNASPKGILAVMGDGSRANYQGRTIDKSSIKPIIQERFNSWPKDQRIIIGAYDEEMYSIQDVLDLAKENNRPVVAYGKVYSTFLNTMIRQNPTINLPIFSDYKSADKINNAVILVTGTRERLYQRLVRIAEDNDIFLKLKESDLVLMIAPPINGLEREYQTITDIVAKKSPNIYDVEAFDFYMPNPSKEDVKETIKVLKPTYYLPISALFRYLVVAGNEAVEAGMPKGNVIVLQNGKIAYFKNGKLASQNGRHKNIGDIIIDGFGVGDLSYEVIREREMLSKDGVVAISSLLSYKKKTLIGPIQITHSGISPDMDNKDLIESIHSWIKQIIDETDEWNHREIQNRIRKKIRKVISKAINKEPMVVITFYEI